MNQVTERIEKPKVRLKFIDMARSVAILLMLEGHFVDDSLQEMYRDPDNTIYSTWLWIRGFTAPVFLTVTGLIFTYLLLMSSQKEFFGNLRVRKGFKRVVELFFWGYMVQWYAFHVLECIAMGIFTILLIYGIYKLIRYIPLWVYYFSAGVLLFSFYLYFSKLPDDQYWPANAPTFIQAMFHADKSHSIFPIIPNMGFTMFGAMLGCLLHDFHSHVKKWYFPAIMFLVGAAFFFYSYEIFKFIETIIDAIFGHTYHRITSVNWLFMKMGMVLMELSVLLKIDILYGKKIKESSLFIKIGQNTLTIYILHMMILYGSIWGFGLDPFINKYHGFWKLNPWQVAVGAVLFIAMFALIIKFLPWIKEKLSFVLLPLKKVSDRIFFIR